ncbi:hypothetical protein L7F22_061878 [Adiantum nelumboides]|nr:hypothetical protein [Adiantum nelumboides]
MPSSLRRPWPVPYVFGGDGDSSSELCEELKGLLRRCWPILGLFGPRKGEMMASSTATGDTAAPGMKMKAMVGSLTSPWRGRGEYARGELLVRMQDLAGVRRRAGPVIACRRVVAHVGSVPGKDFESLFAAWGRSAESVRAWSVSTQSLLDLNHVGEVQFCSVFGLQS